MQRAQALRDTVERITAALDALDSRAHARLHSLDQRLDTLETRVERAEHECCSKLRLAQAEEDDTADDATMSAPS